MKREDLVNILFTFVVGLVVGVYVYFAGFGPTTQKIERTVEDIGDTLVITSEAYGGCDRLGTCPSFNISDNGEYRYIYSPRGVSEEVVREGILPLQLQQSLKRYATKNVLEIFSTPTDPVLCNSDNDGIDVRYMVELDSVVYELDSCGTGVQAESALWQSLGDIWDYFQTSG